MAKFSEKNYLNFTAEDYDLDEILEDYRDAVKDDGCRVGDRFFFYQKGLFQNDVLSFEKLLWVYPMRAAQKGKSGEQFHNDRGVLVFYSQEGERFDLLFKTPHKAESLFSFLVPTLQQYQVVAGLAPELLHGMEEGGVAGFRAALAKLQQEYAARSRAGDSHHLYY